ncbi:hypothetical protein ARMGADRAFT_922873, partial [Armillaria gallica]
DVLVNYFNDFVMVYCRHNHVMKCILSGRLCKAAMYYITDYITKMSLKTYEILLLMGDALMNTHASLLKGEELEARTVLHKCLSQFVKQHQVHTQQAAKIVRGQWEVFSSHKTVPMMSGMLMQYIDEPRLPWQQQHPKLGESLGN